MASSSSSDSPHRENANVSGSRARGRNTSTHPSVVYIDERSAPRVMFAGDRLIEAELPVGTRCIYPKPPVTGLKDPDAAIRYALNHPYGTEPLYAKLRPGMKVVIAIDDLSMPLPPMRSPDVRERVLTIVLAMLEDHGVDDFEMIIATALHRRMTGDEIKHLVGKKIFDKYYPKRLYNHDAEDPNGMALVGETELGEKVILNKKAVESDLLIYVNLNLVPMNGGHKSVTVGLCGYESLKPHHNPYVMSDPNTYMDPNVSALAKVIERMGKVVNQKLNVFTIETTINNRMFDAPLSFLAKNEDEYTPTEKSALKALLFTLDHTPQELRQAIFSKVPAPYELTGVFAGETEAVHKHTIKKSFEQYCVPVEGQADIVICGIPFVSPYNVNAFLNPLLVQVMATGYLYNLHRKNPLIKKGGTLIITHPCTDKFDQEQHIGYIDFVHKLLPETRNAKELHKRFEHEYAANPSLIEQYRFGHAYHPVHAFFMWYWGEAGRQHIGRVIVVGADNEYIPKLLGYETAATMADAIRMAQTTAPDEPQITFVHTAPIVMAEVSLPGGTANGSAPAASPSGAV
jgi:lactate racemase